MFNNEPEMLMGVWDGVLGILSLMYIIALVVVLWKEKDRMIIAFTKRPRWNVIAMGLFPPAWIWMVLVAKKDDDDA